MESYQLVIGWIILLLNALMMAVILPFITRPISQNTSAADFDKVLLTNRIFQKKYNRAIGCQTKKTPYETRWNSKFDAVEDVLSKDQDKLDEVMSSLQLEILDDTDRILLKEFLLVKKPIAVYFDILQVEKNNFLGCVLPCVLKIKQEIQTITSQNMQPNGFSFPLKYIIYIAYLINIYCQCNRFGTWFQDEKFVIATSVHPNFKLDWITDEIEMRSHRKLVARKIVLLQEKEISDKMSASIRDRDPLDFPSKNTATLDELELFFIDKDKDLAILDKYSKVKRLFLEYNTALPSSASVGRLFSAGHLSSPPDTTIFRYQYQL
ncbi:hypothetical protein GHT06_022512 [Daphnia sinensis]|uniref:Uncharacterized protein n=1 Tax=Daphnia sinensis TaxID=1820382 RepID=A0AAD5KXA6_9CRUS|nr:hypothetical protein GHT06_022512 [Daphnia sinensis]